MVTCSTTELSLFRLLPYKSHRVNSSFWTAVLSGMTPLRCHTTLISCHCHITLRVVVSWRWHIQEDVKCQQSEHPRSQEGVGLCWCAEAPEKAPAREEHLVSAVLPLKCLAALEERRLAPFWLPSSPECLPLHRPACRDLLSCCESQVQRPCVLHGPPCLDNQGVMGGC